jgi:hypothetical protein
MDVRDLHETPPQIGEPLRKIRQGELDPQEETATAGIGAVLVRVHDVGAVLEEEPGNRRDDPWPVRAPDEQPPQILPFSPDCQPCLRCPTHDLAWGYALFI